MRGNLKAGWTRCAGGFALDLCDQGDLKLEWAAAADVAGN